MAKITSNASHESAKKALKSRKKQARQEAKLMLAIEEANRDLEKAQKKQSKAQAYLEAQRATLQSLEAKLVELHIHGLEPAIDISPSSAELDDQQEPSELESSVDRSDEQHLSSSDQQYQGEMTSLTEQILASPDVEHAMDVTNEESGELEPTIVLDEERTTEPESAPTVTTRGKATAGKAAAKRQPTSTKRSASRSPKTSQPSPRTE